MTWCRPCLFIQFRKHGEFVLLGIKIQTVKLVLLFHSFKVHVNTVSRMCKHICKSVKDNRLFHINYSINCTVCICVVTVRVYWNIQSLMRPHVVLYLVNMWTVQSYLDGTWRSSYTRPVWFNLHSWNKCSRKLNELYCFSSYWHLWLRLTGGQIHAELVLACEASLLNIIYIRHKKDIK